MQSLGINTVRTMAATEGPDGEPWRIAPSIHASPGRYDAAGVAGVLRFAEELRRRQVYGIFTLNNFWPWSGGMGQYLAWAGRRADPLSSARARRHLGRLSGGSPRASMRTSALRRPSTTTCDSSSPSSA